jgi:hypothetical protein
VAILISQEEERRAFPGFEDTLALSVAPPPPPGPPPLQPPRIPQARPRREARMEPWDECPGATPAWPAATPPDPGLGSRDADSTAANGGLALAASAVQRPLRR